MEYGVLIHYFSLWGKGILAAKPTERGEFMQAIAVFLCHFALYTFMNKDSRCLCLCFSELGIGVSCLPNAIMYEKMDLRIFSIAYGLPSFELSGAYVICLQNIDTL